MKLASHNSLSYIKPKKWWEKLINFTSKCQSYDIETQYEYGVRLFDIRIRRAIIEPGSYYCTKSNIKKSGDVPKSADVPSDLCFWLFFLAQYSGEKCNKFEKKHFIFVIVPSLTSL